MGGLDKAFAEAGGLALLAHSLLAFERCPDVGAVVIVARGPMLDRARAVAEDAGITKLRAVVAGGATRQASSLAGVQALPPEAEFAAVHDAARPMVTPDLVAVCASAAREFGSGVAASRIHDTVRERSDDGTLRLLDRSRLWAIATPQVFRREVLLAALEAAEAAGADLPDDAAAIERAGGAVHLVEWREPNPKATVPEDMALVQALLNIRTERTRHG